jgi:hypothetical protein
MTAPLVTLLRNALWAVMRDDVRQAQGLAACGDTLRQVPKGLPVSNRFRCHRDPMALKLNQSKR